MSNQLVSVIIPTYSRPTNLCRAIDSVLAQTYKPIEIIVVDDNGLGTDLQKETENILSKYITTSQITYVCHSDNRNGSAARNTGVWACHGNIVSLMDDDDVFTPEKIEKQVQTLLERNKDDNSYQGCYCNTEKRYPNGKIQYFLNKKEGSLAEELLTDEIHFNSSTILLFKEAYLKLNGFDERFLRHQDWEFCVRFFGQYKMALACPDETLVVKYATPNVITKDPYRLIEYKEFFLKEINPFIIHYKRYNDICHKQYFDLGTGLISNGYFVEAIKYIRKAHIYKKINYIEVKEVIIRLARYVYSKIRNIYNN